MEDCPQFKVDKSYNDRDDVDETPFSKKLNEAVEKRVGKPTSPQAGMGDTMSDKPFPSSS